MAATAIFGPVGQDLDLVEEVLADVARVEYPALAALLGHILAKRGKRLRPALVFLAAGLYQYPIDRLKYAAAAVELLHTATLVHDDLIDDADTRRGVPTLHQFVDRRSTILVGDYLFARAAVFSAQTKNLDVMNVFGQTLMTICDGELRQIMTAGNWQQTREDYYRRITSKTAALFRTATETGAMLGGAPGWAISALREYGLALGMAFQIVDDVLDFVGDEARLGKPIGSDLRERILTLPALWLLESRPDEPAIRDVFEADGSAEEAVRRAVAAVAGSPAIEYSLGVARSFAGRARAALAGLPDSSHRRSLLALADYVVDRNS